MTFEPTLTSFKDTTNWDSMMEILKFAHSIKSANVQEGSRFVANDLNMRGRKGEDVITVSTFDEHWGHQETFNFSPDDLESLAAGMFYHLRSL